MYVSANIRNKHKKKEKNKGRTKSKVKSENVSLEKNLLMISKKIKKTYACYF